jgi:outer membrane protein OmpA-like peptidoglycan-associated protein
MARPVLGELELQQVQRIAVDGDRVLEEHEVVALEGDFLQELGRRATTIDVSGVLTGEEAGQGLKALRESFRAAEPVSFVSDISTATRVDDVLIEALSVRELAGRPARFEYAVRVRELLQPPPVTEEPPPPVPPEPPEPDIVRDVGTLIVEVTAEDAPDLDPSQATVTAQRIAPPADETSAVGGDVRTLTTHEGAVWTEREMPAGEWTVEATVIDPRPATGSAQATLQAGQTTTVTIPLGPAAVIAQMFVVHFWFDKAFVEPCMREVLADAVAYANDHPSEKLLIVGHTDKVGSDAYNQSLSERRARAVFAFLRFGIDRGASRDEWNGLRQTRPAGALPTVNDNWGLREAQHMLQDLGFYAGNVDGRDGPLTQDAIRAFRCQHGLPPGTTMDAPTWDKLIEAYLEQDSFAVPDSQFLPNCPGEILKWLGCGEKDPVRNVQIPWRPNRRVELLFVRPSALPCDVPEPDTFDLPFPGDVGTAWCLNPSGSTDRCCFINKATLPCSQAPAGRWCRPAPPARFTVSGTIQRQVRAANGSVTLAPAGGVRFVVIDPEGKNEAAEDGVGRPVPGRTASDGTFSFTGRLPGVYTVEVHEDVVVRLAADPDTAAKGNAVCAEVADATDTIDVVIVAAPAIRQIVLPTAVHVMTALNPAGREVRTCTPPGGGTPLPQASPLDDATVRATVDDVASIWVQARINPEIVDIVHEAYAFRTSCEVDEVEFERLLDRCAYPAVLNMFLFGDMSGSTPGTDILGIGIPPEDAPAHGIRSGGCSVAERFEFIGVVTTADARTRGQALAHEMGHYLTLVHTEATTAFADRLMFPGTLAGDKRGLVDTEVARARASEGASFECVPLKLEVTGATQVGGSLSHEFIAVTPVAGTITVEAVIEPDLLDPLVGSIVVTGGVATADPLQRTVDTSVTGTTTVSATYTPVGGRPLTRRVDVRVATFRLDVDGATRVGATDTFVAARDPAADPVRVNAIIDPAPFCVPDTMVVWSGGDAHADPLRRTVSRATGGSTTVSATLAGVTRTVTIIVVQVGLDVDADRDGVVGTNEAGKNTWTFGPGQRGAVILANVDNDNRAGGNTEIDNENTVIDGTGDVPDVAELVIRDPGTLPPGAALFLRASDRTKIRIFDRRVGGRAGVLGPTPLPAVFTLPAGPPGDRVFGMEGTQFPRPGFDGLIRITLELRLAGALLGSDEVQVRVAPWMMPNHLDPTLELYVVRMPDNASFVSEIDAVRPSGVPLRRADGGSFGLDQWIQDSMEIGHNLRPGQGHSVALNAVRSGGLEPFARDELLGPDYGFKEVATAFSGTTFDSHGNLEVSPPVTVGGRDFKLGRIYFGRGLPGDRFNPNVKAFLNAQLVQAPFEIETDWLLVGHVDELFSVVPANVGRPFRLLVADTNEALRILRAVQSGGNGSARILHGSHAAFGERSVDDLLADSALLTQNATICQPGINRALATMVAELGLDPSADVIKIPSFFVEPRPFAFPGFFSALFPGIVNMLVITGRSFSAHRLVPPKAFGPVIGTVDQLEQDVRAKLAPIGYSSSQIVFVDDFDTYHVGDGEVHCGTNSKRETAAAPWWEQVP